MKKKKHLVVICGQHYPAPSPTATCAERYALLFKGEYDIDFISETENGDEEDVRLPSGIFAHTLTCQRRMIEKKSNGMISKVMHTFGSLLLFTNLLGNQLWFRKAVCKKLEEINSLHPIDIVFSVCSPLAAIWAGIDFKKKHPQIRLCSYTVDPYSTPDRIRPLFHTRQSMLNLERNALSSVDCCLLSEEVYNTRTDIREGLHCEPLPYLMPQFLNNGEVEHKRKSAKNTVQCVYAGSFYDSIRNPEYLMRVFASLKGEQITLHLYSKGCEKIISKYVPNEHIVVHGLVSQAELKEIYKKADVLIGVGNAVSDFLPSKTFEYISLRKPIIYFNYEGVDNSVLNDYPCSLQLSNASPIESSVEEIKAFCKDIPTELVNQEQLEKIYAKHTPSSIKSVLVKAFNQ